MRRWWPVGTVVAVALLGPLIVGSADPPDLAPAAVQLLPPGSLVEEATLVDGGRVRALSIVVSENGLELRSERGWRRVDGERVSGAVRKIRLWLGTDHQGRSLLARTLHGARTSLYVALVATLAAIGIGVVVGLSATQFGRVGSSLVRVAVDGLLGLPRVLLLLMLGVIFRGSPTGVGLAIGLASWMEVSRLTEGAARSVNRRPFVFAARAAGAGRWRIARRHLVPNLAPVIAVAAPLVATQAILLESTLSFLGVAGGSATSWGRIVADGQAFLPGGWWLVCFPGLLLSLTALSVHALAASGEPRVAALLPRPRIKTP